jgi:hypothetical protein
MSQKNACWHLIGNGQGKAMLRPGEKVLRFNRPLNAHALADLSISNGRKRGRSRRFFVSGDAPLLGFEHQLNAEAETLEIVLGEWPSVGLASLWCMLKLDYKLRVSCMNLLPSIARPQQLPKRKPLACHFHNWLGERRILMPITHSLNWPEFWLKAMPSPSFADCIAPYPCLLSLPALAPVKGMKLLQRLTRLPLSLWCTQATWPLLVKAEPLFYLRRNVQDSVKWWMFDDKASLLMEIIHRRLALAQQFLFLTRVYPESR